ncbi:Coenzyme PQQ synthesis protein A [Rhodovulum sp. P5]|nr:Coenzyme PQQ synthesis protein A [Rhodovulum sp. P5]
MRGRTTMSWKKPVIREIECGMEINMYGPDNGDDHGVLF